MMMKMGIIKSDKMYIQVQLTNAIITQKLIIIEINFLSYEHYFCDKK